VPTLTETEYNNLRSAYLDLMMGKRVVSAEVAGKTREFQRGDLEHMRALLDDYELQNAETLGNDALPLRTYAKNGGDASC